MIEIASGQRSLFVGCPGKEVKKQVVACFSVWKDFSGRVEQRNLGAKFGVPVPCF
ncbi:MAG: hypothetical protein KKD01_11645 [Proteobacteria bacterium]|nr:hypothetical protein [Pseudomonadota bacterium]MBU1232859.1 hypothetical protein [Pseudomonadota bacterium]MBU1418371.1 hypothetical protein [Pseudomonadota bacterium]MBU1455371.1 hypothetical protein [Pseudomonadota bacterium]